MAPNDSHRVSLLPYHYPEGNTRAIPQLRGLSRTIGAVLFAAVLGLLVLVLIISFLGGSSPVLIFYRVVSWRLFATPRLA